MDLQAKAGPAGINAAEGSKTVLQWAGSSLKTMGKKLRKPTLLETISLTGQSRPASPAASPRRVLSPRPLETLPGVFTPSTKQLHIQVPAAEDGYADHDTKVSPSLVLLPLKMPHVIPSLVMTSEAPLGGLTFSRADMATQRTPAKMKAATIIVGRWA